MTLSVGISYKGNTEICTPNDALLNFEQDRTGKSMKDYASVMLHSNKDIYDECTLLNMALHIIETSEDADIQRLHRSVTVFIDECLCNEEYRKPYMLYRFSDFIFEALDGFQDSDVFNGMHKSLWENKAKGLTSPATAEDIRQMHDRNADGYGIEVYMCKSESLEHLCIQIIYASMLHHFKQRNRLERCRVCKRIFVPKGKSKSCNEKCPLNQKISCAEFFKRGQQDEWRKINNDSLKLDNRLRKRKERAEDSGDIKRIKKTQADLDEFRKETSECRGNPTKTRKLIEKWEKR